MDTRIKADKLRDFAKNVGIKVGLSSVDTFNLADSLVFANLRGIDSHGIIRLPFYLKRLETKGTNIIPKIRIVKEKGATVLLDGDNGMGQVVGTFASKLALNRAKDTGIAYIATRGSSHFGAASYYAYQIAKENMVGTVFSNATSVMAAWGGAKRIIGNNPFSFAAPYKENQPIVLDISMSGVAGGKVRLDAKNNKKIPKGWILDKEGRDTEGPNDLVAGGTLLPFGKHKGYGLAIAIEILAGIMTGAAMMSQIPLWIKDMENPLNIGQCYIAIDISNFINLKEFKKRISWMVDQLKSSPLSEGSSGVFFPGEIEKFIETERLTHGIPISPEALKGLQELSKKHKEAL